MSSIKCADDDDNGDIFGNDNDANVFCLKIVMATALDQVRTDAGQKCTELNMHLTKKNYMMINDDCTSRVSYRWKGCWL